MDGLSGRHVGLLLNFHVLRMTDGVPPIRFRLRA